MKLEIPWTDSKIKKQHPMSFPVALPILQDLQFSIFLLRSALGDIRNSYMPVKDTWRNSHQGKPQAVPTAPGDAVRTARAGRGDWRVVVWHSEFTEARDWSQWPEIPEMNSIPEEDENLVQSPWFIQYKLLGVLSEDWALAKLQVFCHKLMFLVMWSYLCHLAAVSFLYSLPPS